MPLYCDEVQDIMGRIPGRILRIGLTVIFATMLMLLLGSYFFKYPETVSCPVVLTTVNPPQELYARSTGRIASLNVKEHDSVKPGQLIAILQNTANYKDAQILEQILEGLEQVSVWDSVVLRQPLPGSLALGELQPGYMRLYKAWYNFRHYQEQRYLPMKINLQAKQIKTQTANFQLLLRQQDLQKRDFELAQKQYQRDSTFFHRYKDAVSPVEYERKTQEYLQKESSFMDFHTSMQNSEYELIRQNELQVDLQIQYEKELNTYRQELDESYRLLYESHRQWKEKYVLTSDIDGLVTLTGYWSENQVVNSGDRIATVVPQQQMEIIGRAVVDMTGIGKIEKGQQVNIKLSGFPFMEFGILKGKVNNISLVPEKGKGYITEITLTGGMRSSYKEQLRFIQEIEGTAEIITKDQRLLTRLINPLKSKIQE